ncbi:MAG: type II toxin-antitoxin system Phd/YefM family antitoxin [Candidatus Omnitrophota bacterium]
MLRFVTIRDLRSKSAQIQRQLPEEKEMVLTSNGKPIAILSAVSKDTLEESLVAFRRARAMAAVNSMQTRSVELGADRISLGEINKEIDTERKSRRDRAR